MDCPERGDSVPLMKLMQCLRNRHGEVGVISSEPPVKRPLPVPDFHKMGPSQTRQTPKARLVLGCVLSVEWFVCVYRLVSVLRRQVWLYIDAVPLGYVKLGEDIHDCLDLRGVDH